MKWQPRTQEAAVTTVRSDARLQDSLETIRRLLDRHRVLDTLVHRQEGPRRDLLEGLQRRQNLAEVQRRVSAMHAADVAYVLEALELDERRLVWEQLAPEHAGQVFVEVSDVVREWLVESTPRETLAQVLATLDADDLRYARAWVPEDVLAAVAEASESGAQQSFEAGALYDEDHVGHHMTRDAIAVPETHTIGRVLDDLRARGELPPQTDRLFVVDARNILRGAIALQALVLRDPATAIVAATTDAVGVDAHADVDRAVAAFERYDLVSAPVVDDRGKLVGRLTVDIAMDLARARADQRALARAGLSRGEDLFAAPWDSARNRWPWLGVNLVTAFVASRVIGQFEYAIRDLSALAALMPIVASIGGNTGNQTMALVIRALAVDQVQAAGVRRLLMKEILIGLLNGAVWGVLVGLAALWLYASLALGVVMSGAVVLNLLVAALGGVGIPFALHAAGRDPAYGSSVLLTFVTDAMGFLLFLGLASALLL
jgi:magnesium transporter